MTAPAQLSKPASPRPGVTPPGWARWAALGAFAVFAALAIFWADTDPAASAAGSAVAVGAAALLAWERRPRLGWMVLATAGIAVPGNGQSSNVGWFTVCLLAAWCVLMIGRRAAVLYCSGALALFAVEWLWIEPDPGWAAWMAGVCMCVLAGLLVRHEADLVAQLREAQAGLADRARAEERNRIARELHDVIAHTLTVSLLHVSSARLAVQHDPDDAVRALAEAERLGRDSLAEVRLALGTLRRRGRDSRDDHEADDQRIAPLPSAADLPALVERFRAAGGRVALTVDGDLAVLPATAGLALYRILQESLTNAAKHAAGSAAKASVRIGSSAVELTVDTAGPPGDGSGMGLISMRERAESLGGRCEAGPGGSGWLVRATLPLAAVAPAPVPSAPAAAP